MMQTSRVQNRCWGFKPVVQRRGHIKVHAPLSPHCPSGLKVSWSLPAVQSQDDAYQNTIPINETSLVGLVSEARRNGEAYKRIARIHNLLPSCALVLLGAWAANRSFVGFGNWTLWASSLVSGGVAVASVIINDYFDYISGVDGANQPDKPLPSGLIRPDIAILLTLVLYVLVLAAGCVMEPQALRIIIAASVTSTLFYTPFLKAITMVKNMVVAFVIAAAPALGALAVGSGSEGVLRILPLCIFIFFSIMSREILMDINDTEGDENGQIYTVPVKFGKKTALVISALAWTVAMVYGFVFLWTGAAVRYWAPFLGIQVVQPLACFGMLCVMYPLYLGMLDALKSGFDKEIVVGLIGKSMGRIGMGLVLLTLMG